MTRTKRELKGIEQNAIETALFLVCLTSYNISKSLTINDLQSVE